MKLSVPGRFRKVEVEQRTRENLRPGTTVSTDGPSCFRGLEAAGYEHKPRVTVVGKSVCETRP